MRVMNNLRIWSIASGCPWNNEPSLQLAAAVLTQVWSWNVSGITFSLLSSRERNSCNWHDVEFMLRSVASCTFCKSSDAKLYPFWLFTQVELPAAEIAATIDAFCTKHLSELSKVHTPLTSFLISPWLILTTVSLDAKFFGTNVILLPLFFNSVAEEDYIMVLGNWSPCSHEPEKPCPSAMCAAVRGRWNITRIWILSDNHKTQGGWTPANRRLMMMEPQRQEGVVAVPWKEFYSFHFS